MAIYVEPIVVGHHSPDGPACVGCGKISDGVVLITTDNTDVADIDSMNCADCGLGLSCLLPAEYRTV